MDARHAPADAVRRDVPNQCGALQAQFQVVVTPLVAAPSGRLTRGYAWYGPPGRTWPIRRFGPSDLGRLPPGQPHSQKSNRSPISPMRRESIPTVQFVHTVQSMGPCLMSP